MKDTISVTTIFIIVFFLIILFTGYICVSINQTKAFNIKNEIIAALERYGSYTSPEFKASIKESFTNNGYRSTGQCEVGDISFNREGEITTGDEASFCVKIINAGKIAGSDKIHAKIYQVETFYVLDLPIISRAFRLTSKGQTKIIIKGGLDIP